MTSLRMRTAHVLGGSSAFGGEVVRKALAAGYEVCAYSRTCRPSPRLGVSWHVLDLDHPSDLARVRLEREDVVICAAPIVKFALAVTSARHFDPARLVVTSSASALTKRESSWPCDRELSSRLRDAESAILDRFGTRASVLRPTMIYGCGKDRNVARLASWIRAFKVVPIFGRRIGLRAPVHVSDLADVALAIAGSSHGAGAVIHVQGGEVLDYREMVHRIAHACGSAVWTPRIPLPTSLVVALAKHIPVQFAKLAAAAHRMEEDLNVPDDLAALGVSRRTFRPDRKAVGSDRTSRGHS